ncbi:hypothetical protein [Actinomadura sp. WMMA1423]|nr:hypothetical protein [Actinomadura sp. WMMA1423]
MWTMAVTRTEDVTAVQVGLYQVRGPVNPCNPVPYDELWHRPGA